MLGGVRTADGAVQGPSQAQDQGVHSVVILALPISPAHALAFMVGM